MSTHEIIALIETPDGNFTAHFSERGLARLEFPSASKSPRDLCLATPTAASAALSWLRTTQKALKSALIGKVPSLLPPIDLSDGTDFQRAVWLALCGIPPGETRTYADAAAAIGRPNAARAVGQACGANPIPVLIPCHRVVAASGRLGGFSGGLEWKRLLLKREENGRRIQGCVLRGQRH